MRLEPGDVLANRTNQLRFGPMEDGNKVALQTGNLGRLPDHVKDTFGWPETFGPRDGRGSAWS